MFIYPVTFIQNYLICSPYIFYFNSLLVSEKFIPMTKTQLVVDTKVALVVSEARTLIGPILILLENLRNRFKLELNQNQKSIQFLNLRKSKSHS